MGRVAWCTGHGVRLEVQRPGLLSTWITRTKETAVISSHHALTLIPWEYREKAAVLQETSVSICAFVSLAVK